MSPKVVALAISLALCGQFATCQGTPPRFEVAPVFSSYYAPNFNTTPQSQVGGRFTWDWLPHLALEGEYTSTLKSPIAATSFEGGFFSQGLFGIKSSLRWKTWGMFAKFRPGFVRYSSAITGGTTTSTGVSLTRAPLRDAAFDLGGGAEFFMSRHFLFRYDASDVVVHQGPHSILVNGQTETFRSFTKNHFEAEAAVVFRF